MSQLEHIAIIMDGNGRWAQSKGKSRIDGHIAGVKALNVTVEVAIKYGIRCLTVYALSRDNMKRPPQEVQALLSLFLEQIRKQTPSLVKQGVKLAFIGDIEGLPAALRNEVQKAEDDTKLGKVMTLIVAINYSAKWHLAHTVRKLMQKNESLSVERITRCLQQSLPSSPDLLIRTGGERRLSDFLTHHLAYTELVFLETYWPAFNAALFADCVKQYKARDRRFGQVRGSCDQT
ncbi:polyprenyl diphosphate synthase [Gammaproteobacteria bacterium]|nr:polyprenyl diphosphate synthase [Gammaproteobacteria bacterium]